MVNLHHHQENQANRREQEEAQESDAGMGSPREKKEHVCHVCHRSFNSGKALGGHISAHVQARKAKNRIIGLEQEEDGGEEIQEEEEDDVQINVCFICEKHFPSKKSLYGHMRSHPDRAWRGMGRRSAAAAEEIQEEEEPAAQESAVMDLQSRLKHWGATLKRSRTKKMHDGAAPLRHLLEVADKEDRRMRRGGGDDFGSTQKKIKGKGKGDDVSENPRFCRVERSGSCSSEDTDEYYCNNHMDEIVNSGGILNPKEIHRKNHRNQESLEESKKKKRALKVKSEAEEDEEEKKKRCKYGSQALGKEMQHNKVKIEEIIIPNTTNHENQSIGAHRRVESPEIPTAARIPKLFRIDLNEMPEADTANDGGI